MSLSQLIYVSELSPHALEWKLDNLIELNKIHEKARDNNRKMGVTGILLFNSGHFLQVLEGHYLVVNRLYENIAKDPRHTKVERLAFYAAKNRIFEQWNMGLLNLDAYHQLERTRLRKIVYHLRNTSQHDETSTPDTVCALLRKFQEQLTAMDDRQMTHSR